MNPQIILTDLMGHQFCTLHCFTCLIMLKTSKAYSFVFECCRISSNYNPVALKNTSKWHHPHQRDTLFLLVMGCQPTVIHDAYIILNMYTTMFTLSSTNMQQNNRICLLASFTGSHCFGGLGTRLQLLCNDNIVFTLP